MSKLIPKYLEGNELLDESSKYAVLNTYYPFVSRYPLTGHSSLTITGSKDDRYRPYTVDKGGKHKDYNLVTNNCSDATRCALEKTFNKKLNSFLFTTPGDVQDFVLEELNGIPMIKGDSIYYPAEHKYKLDLRPELTKRLHKGMNTVYIPINENQRNFLKLYIEQGNKNKEFKKGGILIPKKQTAWGKLEYKGPQYSQVVELMKKEDPQAYNRLQVANARSLQPNSEVVRWKDANGKEQTSTTNISMSGTDPIGLLYVEGVALNPVFKGLGRVAEYGLAKAGNKWARAKILSRNLDNSPKNIDKATRAFRNSEWSNFLSTRNGDNYYRMARSSKLPSTNIEGEKLFISHTTPWEEFSGLGTSEPIGIKVLYEFPTKTFGVRKATDYRGFPGEIDVTQMGRSHLNFGNTSSGFRGKVLLLPELQAEIIGMNPYTMGVSSRPLNKKGFYDTRPDYEDIYQGNQTTVTSLELKDALLNSEYNLFEYSPSGITKKLYTPLKQKKRLLMDDKTVPVYFGKNIL